MQEQNNITNGIAGITNMQEIADAVSFSFALFFAIFIGHCYKTLSENGYKGLPILI